MKWSLDPRFKRLESWFTTQEVSDTQFSLREAALTMQGAMVAEKLNLEATNTGVAISDDEKKLVNDSSVTQASQLVPKKSAMFLLLMGNAESEGKGADEAPPTSSRSNNFGFDYEMEILDFGRTEPPLDCDSDASLPWWNERKTKYPVLARLARKYLAFQATSVPSERLFSTAGFVCSPHRASMTTKTLNALVVLNKFLVKHPDHKFVTFSYGGMVPMKKLVTPAQDSEVEGTVIISSSQEEEKEDIEDNSPARTENMAAPVATTQQNMKAYFPFASAPAKQLLKTPPVGVSGATVVKTAKKKGVVRASARGQQPKKGMEAFVSGDLLG